jgi:hypothetical protein
MKCPMTTTQIVDEYFIENRHRLLDIAAFLDRLERSASGEDAGADFRIQAFRSALQTLVDGQGDRVRRVHMVFTDPTVEPRAALDRKAAYGAYNPGTEAR